LLGSLPVKSQLFAQTRDGTISSTVPRLFCRKPKPSTFVTVYPTAAIRLLFILVLSVGLFSSGCRKDDDGPDPVDPVDTTATNESAYTQKVLIEKFSSITCGNCPGGDLLLQEMLEEHPGKIIPVKFLLAPPALADINPYHLASKFNFSFTPSGLINRNPMDSDSSVYAIASNAWKRNAALQLEQEAVCGLAIDASKVETNSAEITVRIRFTKALQGDHRLSVYVVENNLTGATLAQKNYRDDDPESPFYQRGDPIEDYVHNKVVRTTLTPYLEGDTIGPDYLNDSKEYVKSYSLPLTNYKAEDVRIIAFVHRVEDFWTEEVLNAQSAKLGLVQDFD